ncbi:MAG: hypothetical protein R3F11_09705 [Verrucomicrobiales bacterium]
MKPKILTHIVWLAIAGGTFALGMKMSQPGKAGDSAGQAAAGPTLNTPSINSGSGSNAGANTSAAATTAATDESLKAIAAYLPKSGPMRAEDMRSAIMEIAKESDPVKANLMFTHLLQFLDADNAKDAFDAVRESANGPEGFGRIALVTFAWASKDGAAAIEHTMAQEDGRARGFGSMLALSGWASADPDAAKAWLASADLGEEGGGWQRGMMTRGLVSGLARTDPNEALKYVQSLEEDQRRGLIDPIIEEQLRLGVDSAANWAENIADADLRDGALNQVARNYSRKDLDAAATWAAQLAERGYGSDAVGEVHARTRRARRGSRRRLGGEAPGRRRPERSLRRDLPPVDPRGPDGRQRIPDHHGSRSGARRRRQQSGDDDLPRGTRGRRAVGRHDPGRAAARRIARPRRAVMVSPRPAGRPSLGRLELDRRAAEAGHRGAPARFRSRRPAELRRRGRRRSRSRTRRSRPISQLGSTQPPSRERRPNPGRRFFFAQFPRHLGCRR